MYMKKDSKEIEQLKQWVFNNIIEDPNSKISVYDLYEHYRNTVLRHHKFMFPEHVKDSSKSSRPAYDCYYFWDVVNSILTSEQRCKFSFERIKGLKYNGIFIGIGIKEVII